MAYAALEPFGELHADFRAGQVCSAVANYAGKVRNADIDDAQPADFMPALSRLKTSAVTENRDGILLDDPVAQANLIRKAIFKEK